MWLERQHDRWLRRPRWIDGHEFRREQASIRLLRHREGDVGVAGAAACKKDADIWFPGRTFHAWLSTSTEDALARVGQGPWFVGTERLGTVTDLAMNRFGTPFNRTATGSGFATGEYVWTGTASGGIAAPMTCADWTNKSPTLMGEIGPINYAADRWTASTTPTCDHEGHLYCLEQ